MLRMIGIELVAVVRRVPFVVALLALVVPLLMARLQRWGWGDLNTWNYLEGMVAVVGLGLPLLVGLVAVPSDRLRAGPARRIAARAIGSGLVAAALGVAFVIVLVVAGRTAYELLLAGPIHIDSVVVSDELPPEAWNLPTYELLYAPAASVVAGAAAWIGLVAFATAALVSVAVEAVRRWWLAVALVTAAYLAVNLGLPALGLREYGLPPFGFLDGRHSLLSGVPGLVVIVAVTAVLASLVRRRERVPVA